MSPDETTIRRPTVLSRLLFFIHRLPASDRLIFHTLLALATASGLLLIVVWSTEQAAPIPAHDGTLREGMIGTVRFINPILANTRVDQDLSALVYQGVLRVDTTGELVYDLARSIEINDDGTEYLIHLRQDAQFHDGRPVTARDVVFTYQLAQEPDLVSPHRGNWSNITIEQVDTFSVSLVLNEPYFPFQENLTLGILPAHIWEEIPIPEAAFSTRNTNPIGSGPYSVTQVERDGEGSIKAVTLDAHDNSSKPIRTIIVTLYPDQDALHAALVADEIDSTAAFSQVDLTGFDLQQYTIHETPLPRVVALLFNQNRSPILRDSNVREALELALDRTHILDQIKSETGIPTAKPIPSGYSMLELSATSSPHTPTSTASTTATITQLQAGDWEQTDDGVWVQETTEGTIPLSLTIRTLDHPTFSAVASAVAQAWETIGIEVMVEEYGQRDLADGIIRTRDFEILLFGMDVTRSVDLYPFWHSSQQTDPGQNIAQYANIAVDSYLQTLRTSHDETERYRAQTEFLQTIEEERPAIFLYTPTTRILARNDIALSIPTRIQNTANRWSGIHDWHTTTENIWPWLHTYINY